MSKFTNLLVDRHNDAAIATWEGCWMHFVSQYDALVARVLTDDEREILQEQNRDGAADAQADWDSLTPEEQEAAIAAVQLAYQQHEADDARARECARLDIAQRQFAER